MAILIIEADVDSRTTIADALRAAGFTVVMSESGRRGIHCALVTPPVLILADWSLPDMSAIDALQILRAQGVVTPFIVVSARASISDAVYAMKAGAADFVELPVLPETLARIVREALRAPFSSDVTGGSSVIDRRVISALGIIDDRYNDTRLRLKQIADQIDISRFYLARLVKLETGRTVGQHLHSRRVREAAILLRTTSLSVKEIAVRVGYDGTKTLDRWFLHFHRTTPSSFRRQKTTTCDGGMSQ